MYFVRITFSNVASQVYLKGNLFVYNPVVKLLLFLKILIHYLQLKQKNQKVENICFNMMKNHYSVVECVFME